MNSYFIAGTAGWLAAVLVGAEAVLPYFLRTLPSALPAHATVRRPTPYLQRMWLHYWVGYLVVVLTLLHSSFVMGPSLRKTGSTGLNAAMLAALLILVQLLVGLCLKSGTAKSRQLLKRFHFWIMIALIVLLPAHVLLNG